MGEGGKILSPLVEIQVEVLTVEKNGFKGDNIFYIGDFAMSPFRIH